MMGGWNTRTAISCFAVLRQIHSFSRLVLLSIIMLLVLSHVDYGGAPLACLPARLLVRLKSVLNAGAQLVFGLCKYEVVTSLLYNLQWLRVPERISFHLAILLYRCQDDAPPYLAYDLMTGNDHFCFFSGSCVLSSLYMFTHIL